MPSIEKQITLKAPGNDQEFLSKFALTQTFTFFLEELYELHKAKQA